MKFEDGYNYSRREKNARHYPDSYFFLFLEREASIIITLIILQLV